MYSRENQEIQMSLTCNREWNFLFIQKRDGRIQIQAGDVGEHCRRRFTHVVGLTLDSETERAQLVRHVGVR